MQQNSDRRAVVRPFAITTAVILSAYAAGVSLMWTLVELGWHA